MPLLIFFSEKLEETPIFKLKNKNSPNYKMSIDINMRQISSTRNLLLVAIAFLLFSCGSSEQQAAIQTTPVEEKPPAKPEFQRLFNGKTLDGWVGDTDSYIAEDGVIKVNLSGGEMGGNNLYTAKEYSDFIFRFEFQLTPGANNGLGIHAPLEGDAAYVGKELQILDNTADKYADLEPYQYHGSVYGIIPAKRGYLKPVGEWNKQEVMVQGSKVKVVLNGTTILDGDFMEASKNGAIDGKEHPGLERNKGHIGFLGHGDELQFRNIEIKDLGK